MDVDVGAETNVVGKVKAVVIGVFIDHDVVAIPPPVITESDIKRGNAEIKSAEPETIGTASGEVPDMATTEAASEMAVLPGMVQVVVGIIAAGIVTDPFSIAVDMRGVRMPITIFKVFGIRMWGSHRNGSMRGNVSAADVVVLSEEGERKREAEYDKSENLLHL